MVRPFYREPKRKWSFQLTQRVTAAIEVGVLGRRIREEFRRNPSPPVWLKIEHGIPERDIHNRRLSHGRCSYV